MLEFAIDSTGSATAGILGPSGGIRLQDVVINGKKVRMRAVVGGRRLVFKAVAQGDSLDGRWRVDHPIYRFFGKGEYSGMRLSHNDLAPLAGNTAAFDSLWSVVNNRFYDPNFNGRDWEALGVHARKAVARARIDTEAMDGIRTALEALGSSHLYLAATPPSMLSSTETARPHRRSVVRWSSLPSGLGYIQITDFRDESVGARATLDSAFAALGSQPGLIIDLRDNPGGSVSLADRLAEHLVEDPIPVGYFVIRSGLQKRGLQYIQELDASTLPEFAAGDSIRADNFFDVLEWLGGAAMLIAGGGAGQSYQGLVALLVNHGTASTAEGVAAALQETSRAIVVGCRTAGAMLAAQPIEIAPGWTLTLPLADYRTAYGVPVEKIGVEPEYAVASCRDYDAVLQRAVELLTSTTL